MRTKRPECPNILQIVVDDMGYGDIGAFGNDAVRTPILDRLVAEGIALTQHYSGSCVCAPARAALLTGRYPHRTGAIDTLEGRGLDRLALREVTLADALRDAGYATGLIGKWHLGALDARYHPNRRGFDEFCGFQGGWSDYYRWRIDYNGTYQGPDGRYLTDVFTEEAVQFIERHSQEPFFLHLAYNAPHGPLQVPDVEAEPYREAGTFSEGVCLLYGMNQRVDQGIGRLLEALEVQGLASNTVVLFVSDNGPHLGSYQWFGQGFETARHNGFLNGSKGSVYEGGIRVPAIMRWPAGLDGGRKLTDLVHFTDWMPTLLAMAGLGVSPDLSLDGQNVLEVLRGNEGSAKTQRFWQWNRYDPVRNCNAAMRDGDWKLIRPQMPEAMCCPDNDVDLDRRLRYDPASITEVQLHQVIERTLTDPRPALLYNLSEDPHEQHNLSSRFPGRVRTMQLELDRWFEAVEADRRSISD
jgi:arylsulfatase A